jgi:mono/diheme cytochrome c family protein
LVLIIRFASADEGPAPSKPDVSPPEPPPPVQANASDMPAKTNGGEATPNKGQAFDPAVVSAGQAAFERSCTTCHDAARSLERSKDLAGWRGTVRRMAAKMGAEIASADVEPISVFLASRSGSGGSGGQGGGQASSSADSTSMSTFATLSPVFRGGNDRIQNPDFIPMAFFGASWQSKVVGARVTLCITCHGVKAGGQVSRIEPLEAAIHLDFSQYLECHVEGMKGGMDAGRFVIPFGAFSAQVNPGSYYTVSPPLIFNMGERIYAPDLGFPVLPMPDADTGVDVNVSVPIGCCRRGPITATMDGYVVNGLQGNFNGIDFLQTRNLVDNNNRVSGGARVTVGDPNIRAGASVTGGRFDDPTAGSIPGGLDYTAYGFDVQAHYERIVRCQFEFARRDSDRVGFFGNGLEVFGESVFGYYAEIELRHCNESHISFLVRYDSESRHSPQPVPGGLLSTGTFDVERLTFGVNIELWRQSLLMIDLEHWLLPEPGKHTADIAGARYTITF